MTQLGNIASKTNWCFWKKLPFFEKLPFSKWHKTYFPLCRGTRTKISIAAGLIRRVWTLRWDFLEFERETSDSGHLIWLQIFHDFIDFFLAAEVIKNQSTKNWINWSSERSPKIEQFGAILPWKSTSGGSRKWYFWILAKWLPEINEIGRLASVY